MRLKNIIYFLLILLPLLFIDNVNTSSSSSSYKAIQVSAGGWHTCALLSNGSVVCWGRNTEGQLGTNDTINRYVPTLVVGFELPGLLMYKLIYKIFPIPHYVILTLPEQFTTDRILTIYGVTLDDRIMVLSEKDILYLDDRNIVVRVDTPLQYIHILIL